MRAKKRRQRREDRRNQAELEGIIRENPDLFRGGNVNLLGEAEIEGTRGEIRDRREKNRKKALKDVSGGALELARYLPFIGDAIDIAEAGSSVRTGKDLYGNEASPYALAGMTAAGLLVPNIIEKPAKASMRALKRSPMGKDIEKGYDQLMSWFKSDDYKNRLRSVGQSTDLADDAVRRLEETDVYIEPSLGGVDGRGGGAMVKGGRGKVEFKEGASDAENLSVHEFGHRSNYADPLPQGGRVEGGDFSDIVAPPKTLKPEGMSDEAFKYYSDPDEIRSRGLETLMYMKRTGKSFDELVHMEELGGWSRSQLPDGAQLMINMYKDTPKGLKRFSRYLNRMLSVTALVGSGGAAFKSDRSQ